MRVDVLALAFGAAFALGHVLAAWRWPRGRLMFTMYGVLLSFPLLWLGVAPDAPKALTAAVLVLVDGGAIGWGWWRSRRIRGSGQAERRSVHS